MTTSVMERLKTGKFGNTRCHCDDVLRFTDSKLLMPFLRLKVSSHVTHLFRFPIKCCHLCSSSHSIHTSCLSTAAVWKWSLHKQKEQSYTQLAGQVACQTLEPRVVNSQNCSNSWHVEPYYAGTWETPETGNDYRTHMWWGRADPVTYSTDQ